MPPTSVLPRPAPFRVICGEVHHAGDAGHFVDITANGDDRTGCHLRALRLPFGGTVRLSVRCASWRAVRSAAARDGAVALGPLAAFQAVFLGAPILDDRAPGSFEEPVCVLDGQVVKLFEHDAVTTLGTNECQPGAVCLRQTCDVAVNRPP